MLEIWGDNMNSSRNFTFLLSNLCEKDLDAEEKQIKTKQQGAL